nr:MAG: holin family protein [Bacteriophage sp.]
MGAIYTFTEQQIWAIGGAFLMMLIDMVTGIAQTIYNRSFKSSTMRRGLCHKATLSLIIMLVICIEILSSHIVGLNFGGITVYVVCIAIIGMEFASILENIKQAYPELADTPIMKIFEHANVGTDDITKAIADEVAKRG